MLFICSTRVGVEENAVYLLLFTHQATFSGEQVLCFHQTQLNNISMRRAVPALVAY